jgi:twitching motility protein PilT
VILIGDLRDHETMEMALEAAETGHLVFSSLNTPNTAKSVEKFVSSFAPSEHSSIRGRLAKVLRYAISQRLIPKRDGGRIPVFEIFRNTARTTNYIECCDANNDDLQSVIKDGAQEGMQIFDDEIAKLIRAGVIDLEVGMVHATDPQQLRQE